MSTLTILITKGECIMCPKTKGKKPVLKWGIVIQVFGNNIIFCIDCLEKMVATAKETERREEKKHAS